jgi:hypothetical protein
MMVNVLKILSSLVCLQLMGEQVRSNGDQDRDSFDNQVATISPLFSLPFFLHWNVLYA